MSTRLTVINFPPHILENITERQIQEIGANAWFSEILSEEMPNKSASEIVEVIQKLVLELKNNKFEILESKDNYLYGYLIEAIAVTFGIYAIIEHNLDKFELLNFFIKNNEITEELIETESVYEFLETHNFQNFKDELYKISTSDKIGEYQEYYTLWFMEALFKKQDLLILAH